MVAQIDSEYRRFGLGPAAVRMISYALFEGRPITTKGRWINPLVFSIARYTTSRRPKKAVKQPVFIIGMGRSGTTILGTALSLHSDIGFLNEPKALWFIANPDDDVIGNYSVDGGKYILDAADADDLVAERFRRLYGAYLWATRRNRVLDKYPEAVFRISYILKVFPDAKFLFLLRDGFDTVRSVEHWCQTYGKRTAGQRHDWWGVDNRKWQELVHQVAPAVRALECGQDELMRLTRDADKAAVEWALTTHFGLTEYQANTDRIKIVRFENLVASPREAIEDILRFCDLPHEERPILFAERNLRPTSRQHQPKPKLTACVQDAFVRLNKLAGY